MVALGSKCVEERGSENKAWVGKFHPWVLPLSHPRCSETLSRRLMTRSPGLEVVSGGQMRRG